MGYDKKHTEDDCDKCQKKVGKKKLIKVPFLYLDKNDRIHKDMSPWMREQKRKDFMEVSNGDIMFTEIYMKRVKIESGYRQYYACQYCHKNNL